MPWKETSTMDQHILFIADYLSGGYTKKALCNSVRAPPSLRTTPSHCPSTPLEICFSPT